jgi:hypothetical protein
MRRYRRQLAREALQSIGVPPEALFHHRLHPLFFLHLRSRVRTQIRTILPLRRFIPAEETINKYRSSLSSLTTATFDKGAYLLDPLAAIQSIAGHSDWMAIGGDGGGGSLKLGISFTDVNQSSSFLPLLVQDGGDTRGELARLDTPNLTPFAGSSSQFHSIWSVFQHLIHTHPRVFLNGDWKFISAVLGHGGASSRHPCFICRTDKVSLLSRSFHHRDYFNLREHDIVDPLLRVDPRWIVPLPLHIHLGLSHYIINHTYPMMFPAAEVEKATAKAKQVHAPGCGGLADVHGFNGRELETWIKTERVNDLLAPGVVPMVPETVPNVPHLERWMAQLGQRLLSKEHLNRHAQTSLSTLIDEIHEHWTGYTKQSVKPKVHMLHHARDFAEQHRFLGKYSEAAIESCHARMNPIVHHSGRNCGTNTQRRLKRALADVVTVQLQAVQLKNGV